MAFLQMKCRSRLPIKLQGLKMLSEFEMCVRSFTDFQLFFLENFVRIPYEYPGKTDYVIRQIHI